MLYSRSSMKLIYRDPVRGEPRAFDLRRVKIVKFGRSRQGNQIVLRCRRNPSDPKSPEDKDFSLKISRHHLEIVLENGRPAVVDRGSKKGTSLAGRLLAPNEPHLLGDGDAIGVSDVLTLRVAIRPGEIRLTREEPRREYELVLGRAEQRLAADFARVGIKGVLAILFAGQAGAPLDKRAARRRDQILGTIVGRDGVGRVLQSTAAGILAIFRGTTPALDRAAELQKAVAARPPADQIRLRLGLDVASVAGADGFDAEAFGACANRAARVMAHADGGQLLLTEAARQAGTDWIAARKAPVQSIGTVKLKGLSEPLALFRLGS